MKKTFILGLVLTFLLISTDASAFCCKDPDTRQWKCYTSGCCYNDLWYPELVGFKAWSASPGPQSYTVGRATSVAFYIQNMGCTPDKYNIAVVKDFGEYNHLAPLDFPITETDVIYPGEVKSFYPVLRILATDIAGTIEFQIESQADASKDCPTLFVCPLIQITGEGMPVSLPEFGLAGLIEIIVFATIAFLMMGGVVKN